MHKRKLNALGYPKTSSFDPLDDQEFKQFVVWIEDQKVRHLKIEDRATLRDIESSSWTANFNKYLYELHFPFPDISNRNIVVDWLLGLAVKLEYGDNIEKYQACTAQSLKAAQSQKQSGIFNIDPTSKEFKDFVTKLAKLLSIPMHEDYVITLNAIRIFIQERLTNSAKQDKAGDDKSKSRKVKLESLDLGFETGDPSLDNAAKALRLLHINDLRQLQTDINNAIVAVQALTANPKTDSRLGKVGRS